MQIRSTLTAALVCGAGLVTGACGGDPDSPATAAAPAGPKLVESEAPVQPARVLARIPIGEEPCSVTAAAGFVWVSEYGSGRVLKVDPQTDEVVGEVEVHARACELASDGERVWVVTDQGDYLEGIDASDGRIVARIRGERGRGRPALGEGEIWWSSDTQNQVVSRYDASGRLVRRIEGVGSVEAGPADLARAGGAVWVGNEDATVQRIDPASNEVTDTIEAGPKPAFLTVHDGAVWFANLEQRTIRRLDPRARRITHVLAGGGGELAFDDAGGLWAVGANPKTPDGRPEPPLLYRYDARTGTPSARLQVGEAPGRAGDVPPLQGVAVAAGSIWVGSPADGALYRVAPPQ
jgi:DNA-binding beta-propeller fold protein YncE